MPFRTLLGLILTNLIWSAHPAMGKLVLESCGPSHAAWFRYTTALFVYVAAALAFRVRGPIFFRPRRTIDWIWVVALGFATFCFSPLLQLTGLAASRATDNALIVAMEPLMTVLLAALFLRERLHVYHAVSFGLALSGFALLAGLTPPRASGSWDAHMVGNVVILVSLLGEAAYSTLGRKLVDRHPPMGVFGTALAAGVVLLTVATWIDAGPPDFSALSGRSWFGLLWLGPLGTAGAYLYWMSALSASPVASIAVTLFIQPLMGSVWGYAFLGERLTLTQSLGGALILVAVLVPAWAVSSGAASGRRGARRSARPAVVPPGPL